MKTTNITPPIFIFKQLSSFIFVCCCLCLFYACGQEENMSPATKDDGIAEFTADVKISPEGYLNFETEDAFRNLIFKLDSFGANNSSTKSCRNHVINGFKSIAIIKAQNSLRSLSSGDQDEMSEAEYNVMKAENLLADPILQEVMDTTLRISIDGRLFKVTKYGTFSTSVDKAKNIETAIANFDTLYISSIERGVTINLGNDVIFTNSFGYKKDDDSDVYYIKEIASTTKSTNTYLYNNYNVNSYKWKNNSLFQKYLDFLRGKDVSKENYFTHDSRRIQVNLFAVNYGYYASAGVKVEMQRQKHFLGIPYWVKTDCDNLVVGFDKVYGRMEYSNPRSFSSIDFTGSTAWSSFTGKLNGYISTWTYGIYHKYDLIKDWVDDIYLFLPKVTFLNQTYPDQSLMNKLYDTPADLLASFLSDQVGKYIYDPLKGNLQIQPKDPAMSYFAWGNTSTTFSKDRSFIRGVKEYGRQGSKTIRFAQAVGLTYLSGINNGTIGFIPNEFEIEDIDCFGAAYNEGEWRGVRFTK